MSGSDLLHCSNLTILSPFLPILVIRKWDFAEPRIGSKFEREPLQDPVNSSVANSGCPKGLRLKNIKVTGYMQWGTSMQRAVMHLW